MNVRVDPSIELPTVVAELNYSTPMRERPRNYTYDPPPGVPRSNVIPEPHQVAIRDLRPVAQSISLDREVSKERLSTIAALRLREIQDIIKRYRGQKTAA